MALNQAENEKLIGCGKIYYGEEGRGVNRLR